MQVNYNIQYMATGSNQPSGTRTILQAYQLTLNQQTRKRMCRPSRKIIPIDIIDMKQYFICV